MLKKCLNTLEYYNSKYYFHIHVALSFAFKTVLEA